MRLVKNLLVSVVAVVAIVLVIEVALQLFVTHVAGRGRMFQSDAETGWINIPGLRLSRLNAAGEAWTIENDSLGNRLVANPASFEQTMLIVGDSFAFGEGVAVADRFDAAFGRANPDLRIVNTGTMGWGTDQEYVSARPHLGGLKAGDLVFVLFGQNDFYDVLRRTYVLRSKPYFEVEGDDFRLEYPALSVWDTIRDNSFLASLVGRALEPPDTADWDFEKSRRIIREILSRLRKEAAPGVVLVLAHHGKGSGLAVSEGVSGGDFCNLVDLCLDLDPVVATDDANFLPDRHWNVRGHAIVGQFLATRLAAHLRK